MTYLMGSVNQYRREVNFEPFYEVTGTKNDEITSQRIAHLHDVKWVMNVRFTNIQLDNRGCLGRKEE